MDLELHSPHPNAMVNALVRIWAIITSLKPPTVEQVLWLVLAVLVTTAARYWFVPFLD